MFFSVFVDIFYTIWAQCARKVLVLYVLRLNHKIAGLTNRTNYIGGERIELHIYVVVTVVVQIFVLIWKKIRLLARK